MGSSLNATLTVTSVAGIVKILVLPLPSSVTPPAEIEESS